MKQQDNIDMGQVEYAFGRVVPGLINQYLGPLGFDITYRSPRVCETQSKHCILTVQVDLTAIEVTLIPKPGDESDQIKIDSRPTQAPYQIGISQEVARQLQLAIDNYGHILRGEVDR